MQTYRRTYAHGSADSQRHVQIVDPRNALILLRRLQNFVFECALQSSCLLFPIRVTAQLQHAIACRPTRPNQQKRKISTSRIPHITIYICLFLLLGLPVSKIAVYIISNVEGVCLFHKECTVYSFFTVLQMSTISKNVQNFRTRAL